MTRLLRSLFLSVLVFAMALAVHAGANGLDPADPQAPAAAEATSPALQDPSQGPECQDPVSEISKEGPQAIFASTLSECEQQCFRNYGRCNRKCSFNETCEAGCTVVFENCLCSCGSPLCVP